MAYGFLCTLSYACLGIGNVLKSNMYPVTAAGVCLLQLCKGEPSSSVGRSERWTPPSRGMYHRIGVGKMTSRETALLGDRELLSPTLESVLAALEATLPIPVVLFDDVGGVIWVSRRAVEELDLQVVQQGHETLLKGSSPTLDVMRLVARSALNDAEPPPANALGPKNKVIVRRYETEGGSKMVLIALGEGPLSPYPSETMKKELDRAGLTSRESDVATLAVQGFNVPNISARLDMKPSSVQTFIKRIYRKFNVSSRAELSFLVLSGAALKKN